MLNFSNRWKKLRAWWATPLGQSFLEAESLEIKSIIPHLFGYHLLLLGEPQFASLLKESPINHRVWIHSHVALQNNCSPLQARQDKLPIISDSIDMIYLAHCLEFSKNPHEVLRETFRVLVPEGSVVISHFNPWSLWGIWRILVRYLRRAPWDGRFITVARLRDWLALLGFDVVEIRPYFFCPPIAHAGLLLWLKKLEQLGRWCWPFWGGGYVVLARKRVITLTPIRPTLTKKRDITIEELVEPVR